MTPTPPPKSPQDLAAEIVSINWVYGSAPKTYRSDTGDMVTAIAAALQSERDRAERTERGFGKVYVDRLRTLTNEPHEHGGGMNECHICDQPLLEAACDKIELLRRRAEAAEQSLATLRKEALKVIEPIASIADCYRKDSPGENWNGFTAEVPLGHCRAARDFRDKWKVKE